MCGDDLGVQLVFIPEEYGGMGGGAFDSYRVCESMARIDIGLATSVFATFLGSDPILVGATGAEASRLAGPHRRAGHPVRLRGHRAGGGQRPRRAEDHGHAGARRRRSPATGSTGASSGSATARSPTCTPSWRSRPAGRPGSSWRGQPGFTAAKPEDKHGIRLSNTAALFLDDVVVPADHLIGGVEGRGLVQAQQVFGYTRLMVAAFGLGGGWEALDRAIAYSTTRVQGGAPLARKQGYTHKLIVPHAVRLEAARAFIEETATRVDAGEGADGALNTEGAIAKYLATEAGNAAAEAAIQAHGGYGYTREYLVEKIKRDVRITTIYEGTSEILEMTIARDRWQQHLKTAGGYYRDGGARLAALGSARRR